MSNQAIFVPVFNQEQVAELQQWANNDDNDGCVDLHYAIKCDVNLNISEQEPGVDYYYIVATVEGRTRVDEIFELDVGEPVHLEDVIMNDEEWFDKETYTVKEAKYDPACEPFAEDVLWMSFDDFVEMKRGEVNSAEF